MKKKVNITKITKSNSNIDKKLINNFVSLQKVLTNLSIKLDNLSDQIAKLLEVFEISAKALAEKDFSKFEKSDDKELLKKLDTLLEQNKTIARGLTLMHEKNLQNLQKFQRPPQQIPEIPRKFPQKKFPQSSQRFKGFRPSPGF